MKERRRREKQLAYIMRQTELPPQQIKKARNLSVFGNAKGQMELLKERHAYGRTFYSEYRSRSDSAVYE